MNYSPLRYPGGKTKLAPHIKSIIEYNDLKGCQYFEPYAGGAGVALALLIDGYVSNIHINDADYAVYAFWHSLIKYKDTFLKRVEEIDVTIDNWHLQKDILTNFKQYSLLELGVATFFLNRTNRSGILKGGVIGGKEQKGEYKLDARFNKLKLLKQLEIICQLSDKIKVTNVDAAILLTDSEFNLSKNSIIYLDPPYYVKGQGLYRNFYNHEDHVEIMNILNNINSHWIVSYDDNDEIKKIYHNYRHFEYTLNYSAQCKMKGKEVIIYSDSLNLPLELQFF